MRRFFSNIIFLLPFIGLIALSRLIDNNFLFYAVLAPLVACCYSIKIKVKNVLFFNFLLLWSIFLRYYFIASIILSFYIGFLVYAFNGSLILAISIPLTICLLVLSYVVNNAQWQIFSSKITLSSTQLPELYEKILFCAKKLGMNTPPKSYLISGRGYANAYVVRDELYLTTQLVDVLKDDLDSLNFIIGHELCHIINKDSYTLGQFKILENLPVLGFCYKLFLRNKEYICDESGLACCETKEIAAKGLIALITGSLLWKQVDIHQYANQINEHEPIWTILSELGCSHPLTHKRVARLLLVDKQKPNNQKLSKFLAYMVSFISPGSTFFSKLFFIIFIAAIIILSIPTYDYYQKHLVIDPHGFRLKFP